MAEISIVASPAAQGWSYVVQISEPNGQTRHSVTVRKADYETLTKGAETTPEVLVRKSFEFLLEREHKHQILRQFELPQISKYYPEYPAEIRKRL